MIKNKNLGGFTDRQRKGLGVGKAKNLIFLSRAPRSFSLVDVFEKNEKKNKTTSVYMLGLFSRFIFFLNN